ncbi:hypothetical protein ED733_001522 [Metarhizium rileyi]|uniref:Uncharacterized protein n=1 Tax=Metarhizium rileyi (strain RCEF 4871) TaxID=1649241 RepID=A0A5C6G850_METRR|nr:hypothetical protein ED733_001522 [Metarhizium rileyi]
MVLVDDTNTQPKSRPEPVKAPEQKKHEKSGGVEVWLLKSMRAPSTYVDDGGNAGTPTAQPTERESLYEDDVPDSGENTSCDEAQEEAVSERKKARTASDHGRVHSGSVKYERSSAQRKPGTSYQHESFYGTAPTDKSLASAEASRESAYSVAGERDERHMSRPARDPVTYSTVGWDSFGARESLATPTFPDGINHACLPAPLQPTRYSGSTTTRGSATTSVSGIELSQRTSISTRSASVRKSTRVSDTAPVPRSAPVRRTSLPVSGGPRSSPWPRVGRARDGRQSDGRPSSAGTSADVATPISERRLSPRTVISRDSLPVSETSSSSRSLAGPSANRTSPPFARQKHTSGQGPTRTQGNPVSTRSSERRSKDSPAPRKPAYEEHEFMERGRDRADDRKTIERLKVYLRKYPSLGARFDVVISLEEHRDAMLRVERGVPTETLGRHEQPWF